MSDDTSPVNHPVSLGELIEAAQLFDPHSVSLIVRRTDESGYDLGHYDEYVERFTITTHRDGLTEITLDVS